MRAEKEMRSLPKVIRPGRFISVKEVVQIPDAPLGPVLETVLTDVPTVSSDTGMDEMSKASAAPCPQSQDSIEKNAAEAANDISRKILQRARGEREEILNQAHMEAQQIRQGAREEAYQCALEEKRAEITECIAEVEQLLDELQSRQRDFLKEYEAGLFSLSLDITQKILNTAIPEHEELMIPLVKEAVSSVKNAEWIDVQISERLPHLVELLKTEFAQCKNPGHIEITAINAPQDTCIINTSDGAIDATASVQIENLRARFEKNQE